MRRHLGFWAELLNGIRRYSMKQRIMMGTLGLLVTLIVASCGSSNHEETDQPQVTLDSGSAVDTGTIEGKINQVTELLRFGPKNWELWAKRSKLYYEGGNIPRAMADIEKAIANSIDEPEAYYLRGFYYYAQKEDSAAMRDFKRAANLNSTNPETYHLIGNLCLLKGEYERADVAYDHAIRLDSMEPTPPSPAGPDRYG
jgi:tetratricopeptide (TPR) repeat protein